MKLFKTRLFKFKIQYKEVKIYNIEYFKVIVCLFIRFLKTHDMFSSPIFSVIAKICCCSPVVILLFATLVEQPFDNKKTSNFRWKIWKIYSLVLQYSPIIRQWKKRGGLSASEFQPDMRRALVGCGLLRGRLLDCNLIKCPNRGRDKFQWSWGTGFLLSFIPGLHYLNLFETATPKYSVFPYCFPF